MFTLWKKFRKTSAPPAPSRVVASLATDVRCRHETNEDSSRYIHPGASDAWANKGILALVADGMGGHSAGEVASRIAVETISRVYYQSRASAPAALKKAFQQANRAIYQAASQAESWKGMGTTGTALVLRDGLAVYAHVGDSRLYMVRGGEIYLMSEDHSLVMEMVKRGALSLTEARRHADRNVLVRALGVFPEVELERPVAIKALRPELARQPQVVERFRTEAVVLAKLNHPHIATLYSFIRQGDDLFMVMEFVPGETLEQVIRTSGAMPCGRALALFDQALDGMDHAHQHGVVHRDIKPGNIMRTPHGAIKVMDFGIARMRGPIA